MSEASKSYKLEMNKMMAMIGESKKVFELQEQNEKMMESVREFKEYFFFIIKIVLFHEPRTKPTERMNR